MIFESTIDYKFKQPILKIHSFVPAYDGSVVLHAQKCPNQDYLLHFDRDSNLRFKYDFKGLIYAICMPDEERVVVLRP
jgi:hypothetical protein